MAAQPSTFVMSQADNPNPRHLAPKGDLTIFEAMEFRDALVNLLANDGLVSLDLGGVTRADTAIIQLLWAARKEGRMFVCGVSPEFQATLTHLGFTKPLSE
jgi:anti-anti-sigma regulatory factor